MELKSTNCTTKSSIVRKTLNYKMVLIIETKSHFKLKLLTNKDIFLNNSQSINQSIEQSSDQSVNQSTTSRLFKKVTRWIDRTFVPIVPEAKTVGCVSRVGAWFGWCSAGAVGQLEVAVVDVSVSGEFRHCWRWTVGQHSVAHALWQTHWWFQPLREKGRV